MRVRRIRGAIVTPEGLLDDGVVEIADGTIAAVRAYRPRETVHMRASYVLPGYVDMHVHGGGGHTMTTGDAADTVAAAEFHRRHGTTTLLASLVSAPFELMAAATAAYAPLVADGEIAGLHYEGPYLSALRCGAQNPAHLRDPSLDELNRLLDLGGVRMVTIAPELPGAVAAIELLVARGVVAAVGHTDATYDQTLAAVRAGASVATHLCNGMRPVHHREPGPIIALLASAGVTCEVVADGVHLHDGMLRFVAGTAGSGRTALITDAMTAAGMADGRYDLGGLAVDVANGVARLSSADGAGSIAGSTLTMDAALRRMVHSGVSLVDAARMAATTPAAALGLADRGAVSAGLRADLVLLDDALAIVGVLRGGVPDTLR
jgi:N-acetylglucosamine-6-phosphate deacetylase